MVKFYLYKDIRSSNIYITVKFLPYLESSIEDDPMFLRSDTKCKPDKPSTFLLQLRCDLTSPCSSPIYPIFQTQLPYYNMVRMCVTYRFNIISSKLNTVGCCRLLIIAVVFQLLKLFLFWRMFWRILRPAIVSVHFHIVNRI